jgi:hypothetical protein
MFAVVGDPEVRSDFGMLKIGTPVIKGLKSFTPIVTESPLTPERRAVGELTGAAVEANRLEPVQRI